MAPSTRHFSILLFIVLFSSLHKSQARNSQLFSKVTTSNTNDNDNNNGKETVVVQPSTNENQQPNFIPDTQNGYGLYGHEPGHFSPAAADNLPFKTESGETTTTTTNNNNYYYNKDAYVTQPQGMSDTRIMGRGYTTAGAAANDHYNGGNNYNGQQQGMSDTRFLENGKYYYDINRDNNYPDKYGNSRGVEHSNNYYNTQNGGFSDTKFMEEGYTTTGAAANNHYNGGNNHNTQLQQGMSDTRFMENGKYYYDINRENNYPNKYGNSRGVEYNNNNYNTQNKGYSDTKFMEEGYTTTGPAANNHHNGGNNYNTQQQQGMSDTRFLENGKYYYDIKSENNYPNKYGNSREIEYNDKGYDGNYNENSYEQSNSMEGYRNQEESQKSEEEYVP